MNDATLPRDTYVAEGRWLRVEDPCGAYFLDAQYENREDMLPRKFEFERLDGRFAAVNAQDPEGNGIDGVFATEFEAETYLIERYGEDLSEGL